MRNLARQNNIPEKVGGSGAADHVEIYAKQITDYTRDSITKTMSS